ncbi:acidic fibroblast growth factor intracellular-binding protein [Ctenocephalides felis]|uniref:acidic fibroblast growth factor intracellular-binding protein n=1 Tax=Ctenocephalides felis TaxID=7515 RepID=UPI000E6E5A1A|nr:acidic fibroblast growth factor intracellular-binding protein [Ctenocephalides felis]
MYAEIDVFISNYTLVDPEIYQLWIEGYSSSEAVSILKQNGVIQQIGVPLDLIASDVLDHYRTYSLLERLLGNPPKLSEQPAFQLEPQTRTLLIEKYYSLDDIVVRELLGKKLSSRHRKDLDEVADKTGVKLKSCRRQFDNIKRIFKTVEELPGNIWKNVKIHFLVPENIARKYGAIVFISCLRFETSKRRLQYLTFSDLLHCAESIMSNWTYTQTGSDYFDTEMDREFLLDLREIRVLSDKEKELKHLICIRLKSGFLERSYQELESNFRSYSRSIISIGCSLHRTRELRCLFNELSEKLIEPWRNAGWTDNEVKLFLPTYAQSALDMDVLKDADLKAAWDRYMKVISSCLIKIYHV